MALLILNPFQVFVLVLARTGGLVMTAPAFGSRSIPVRVRALLAVGMALIVTPLYYTTPIPGEGNIFVLAALVVAEMSVGAILGFGVRILFSGVQVVGAIIGQMGGTRLADAYDPNFGETMPVFGQLFDMIMVTVFVIIGGHRMLIEALLDTFRWMPPGAARIPRNLVQATVELVTQSFILGIRAAAPAVIALLLSMILMGLISRTLPQLNIMVVGFNINALVGIGVTALTVGLLVLTFQEQIEPTIYFLQDLFRTNVT